jgi:hypothetical protein
VGDYEINYKERFKMVDIPQSGMHEIRPERKNGKSIKNERDI